jgi:hypothetical protein
MKTMAELEAENSEGFCNPVLTLEQEAIIKKMHDERKAYEAQHMAIEEDEEDEEDEDDIEVDEEGEEDEQDEEDSN